MRAPKVIKTYITFIELTFPKLDVHVRSCKSAIHIHGGLRAPSGGGVTAELAVL